MDHKPSFVILIALILAVLGLAEVAAGVPSSGGADTAQASLNTAFTYQGRLDDAGGLANGLYDFEFKLFDNLTSGNQIGSTLVKSDVTVTNGLLTVELDFGSSAFNGTARYLEIGLRPGSSTGAYSVLAPRQPLTPTPYALSLPGLYTQLNSTSPNLIGGFHGNQVSRDVRGATIGGGGERSAPNQALASYTTVAGGHGNQADAQYATVAGGETNEASGEAATVGGGRDNQARDPFATVGGGRGNTATDDFATVGGGEGNEATGRHATAAGGYDNQASQDYATIGGGVRNEASSEAAIVAGGENNEASGQYAAVAGGVGNVARGETTTVGGGKENTAANQFATIGGGEGNEAAGKHATVAGGHRNDARQEYATIGGGVDNAALDRYTTVGGGQDNTADGQFATVGGGQNNEASDQFTTVSGGKRNVTENQYATVGGGENNQSTGRHTTIAGGRSNVARQEYGTIGGGAENHADGDASTIAGGENNSAGGQYATVAGGANNTAGGDSASVAGGRDNEASGQYATVAGGQDNSADGDYSFAAGRRVKIDEDHHGAFLIADASNFDFESQAENEFAVRATGGVRLISAIQTSNGQARAGVRLSSGAGAWLTLSDRDMKTNFAAVDAREILQRLAAVPVQTWNYKSQTPSIRHIGPVAQDFSAAFGVGEDDRFISTVDADGVALAAIQGLHQMVQAKEARIATLEAQNTAQQQQIAALGARLEMVERTLEMSDDPARTAKQSEILAGWFLLAGGLCVVGLVLSWRYREGVR